MLIAKSRQRKFLLTCLLLFMPSVSSLGLVEKRNHIFGMENKSLSIRHSLYLLCTCCMLGTVLGARNTVFDKIRVLAHDAHSLVDSR